MKARRARSDLEWIAPLIVLLVTSTGCGVRTPPARLYPALAPFSGQEIEQVRFVDAAPFPADTLALLVESATGQGGPFGGPTGGLFAWLGRRRPRLDLTILQRDVNRIALFFNQSGYFGTAVVPVVEPLGEDRVAVAFLVSRGDPVFLASLELVGLDTILEPEEMLERLPLREGDLFDLGDFTASADTIRLALLREGHAFTQVLRNYSIDTVENVATAMIEAVPGPRVVVDSIVVVGAPNLGRRGVLRQLTFRQGDLLRADRLIESQRNLYGLELVQFATVAVADDTLQVSPLDSTLATVAVRVSEAPVHVVEAAVGYGTVECFRTEARWVDRSFRGGARRLVVNAQVTKIGIAGPVDFGLGGVCRSFRDDAFADILDYRISGDLTQPWFLSPRNHLSFSAFVERASEPRAFQREARGGRAAITRQLRPREVLTGIVNVERGRVVAAPVIFCAAFLVCLPTDIEALGRSRWRNTLGADYVRDRTDRVGDPSRGQVLRGATAWASPLLGSDVRFVRGVGEFSHYTPIGRITVFATSLRLGSFFGAATLEPGPRFVPPEERFFAGGASTVRGFGRNELGPGVYVAPEGGREDEARFSPLGGTSLFVGNAELRLPSPFLRDVLRLAIFADAGAVTFERAWELAPGDLRITPGFGLRAQTPAGPVRFDVAYNPYRPIPGPLFVPDPETDALVRVQDRFQPPRPPFFRRFRLHLAVGQPF